MNHAQLRPSVRGARLASIEDASEYCGVSTKTIRRRIADGTITAYRVGPRLLRVDLNQVDNQLLQQSYRKFLAAYDPDEDPYI